jgi:plastocyanin
MPPSGDPVEIPADKPSDSYTGQGFYHSGAFATGPDAPTEFQLTFPQPGTFSYTCALHGHIGHNGVVIVEP